METKYVWDITVGRSLSKRQIKVVDEISNMLISGGKIRDLRNSIQQLKIRAK